MTLRNHPPHNDAEIQCYLVEFKGSETSRFECFKFLHNLANNVAIQTCDISKDKCFTDAVLKSYLP
jgi:hypothetical protein